MVVTMVVPLFRAWWRDVAEERANERAEERRDRENNLGAERELRRTEAEARMAEANSARAKERELIDALMKRSEADKKIDADHGGYIYLDMPENKKSLFHDVLKGFENYAKLKGYEIRFSADATVPDRIAFKFTLLNSGFTISPQQVKKDLQEYITKVERGDPLDDLPIVLPEAEHNMVLLVMRNRINFLHHTLTAQANVMRLYEETIRSISGKAFSQAPTFYLQQGNGTMNPTNYSATNSSQIAQGQQNRLIGNSSTLEINMGNTLGEQQERLNAIYRLKAMLWNEEKENPETKERVASANEMLGKAATEMSDEPVPDPSRVQRYLTIAKDGLKALALGREVQEAAEKLWDLFRLSS